MPRLANPAVVSNPLALTTPTLMTNPQDPDDPTNPLFSAGMGADAVGYFGLALTSSQRERKNTDRLVRLHRRRLRIEREIAQVEDKLESLGVDVDELYDMLGLTPLDDDDEDDGMVVVHRGGGGRPPRGGNGLPHGPTGPRGGLPHGPGGGPGPRR